MPDKKSAKKAIVKNCEICGRSARDNRQLGPFVETKSIAAHHNCVLFCPKRPDKVDLIDDGICGVSDRFIRMEGKRSKALVSDSPNTQTKIELK